MRAQFKTIRVSVQPMGCQEVFSAFLTYLQPQSFPLRPLVLRAMMMMMSLVIKYASRHQFITGKYVRLSSLRFPPAGVQFNFQLRTESSLKREGDYRSLTNKGGWIYHRWQQKRRTWSCWRRWVGRFLPSHRYYMCGRQQHNIINLSTYCKIRLLKSTGNEISLRRETFYVLKRYK